MGIESVPESGDDNMKGECFKHFLNWEKYVKILTLSGKWERAMKNGKYPGKSGGPGRYEEVYYILNRSTSASVVQESSAAVFCCEALEMFCPLHDDE